VESSGVGLGEHGFDTIVLERMAGGVGLVRLNRPNTLNALNLKMSQELVAVMRHLQRDSTTRAIVLVGSDTAFAAGADIKEMAERSFVEQRFRFRAGDWLDEMVRSTRKPLIAAVRGFALGGGCELALACDIVIAGRSAQFGQPEVTLGTIPGWGGTQRLMRAVGKAKAMEMVLTGRRMTAEEAESSGIVARVMPDERTVEEAIAVATAIASYSPSVVETAKDCVNYAHESSLEAGLRYERALFHSTFALDDQREGMTAFIDKRTPNWSNK